MAARKTKKSVPVEEKMKPVELKPDEAKLEIVRCSMHGYYAVVVNDSRISPSKCCGSWSVLRSWTVKKSDITKPLEPR